jgi:predicted  nucleic acid-binding Zn-ribbon protein
MVCARCARLKRLIFVTLHQITKGAKELNDEQNAKASLQTAYLREYVDLQKQIDSYNEQIAQCKKRQAELDEPIKDFFQEAGISAMTVGDKKLKLNQQIHIRPKAGMSEQMREYMKRVPELADLVKESVNDNSLSAWYREKVAMSEKIPEGLLDIVHVIETFTLKVNKA